MPITVTYQKTALRGATPISGTLECEKDSSRDTLTVSCRVFANGRVERTQYVGEPGTPSEIGRNDFEFQYFQRWDVPSSVRIRRYFTTWQSDNSYLASVIATFFGIEDVAAVHALIEGRSA